MKNKFKYMLVSMGMSALIFSGCSKLPQAEIDAVNAAIEEARTAGAELYVPESYIALQDSLSAVMVGIEAQGSKLIKNYSASKEQLASVTQYAGEVKFEAEARKEAIKVEIMNTIAEVKTLIETNKQLIMEAPRGKEGTTALMAIKGELNAIEASINEAGTMLENGEYLSTLDKATATKAKALSINEELTQVIAKYKANVQNRKA